MAIGPSTEALRLAEASDWKGLQRLVERHPAVARAKGEYGMLPIHWACTDRRAPLALLNRLLAAHPAGARARNAAELLPLHIAIRAGAPAAWLSRLVKAFPGAAQARIPSGETAVELAEAMRLGAERLKVLYRAERELSPEIDSGSDQEELEGEDDVLGRGSDEDEGDAARRKRRSTRKSASSSRGSGSRSKKTRTSQGESSDTEQAMNWPAPYVGNGGGATRLSAATELSDVEIVDEEAGALSSSSRSSLSEGAVRLSASRDHLVSPSSVSSGSHGFSPPNSVSAPEPLSSALADANSAYARRNMHGRSYTDLVSDSRRGRYGTQGPALRRPSDSGVSADDRDGRSVLSTPMGGRHQSLPIIPSFDASRRNSVGAFGDRGGYMSGSDDSDVMPGSALGPLYQQQQQAEQLYGQYQYQSQPQQPPRQQQQQRAYQTQPHPPGKQRHHSPFAYRRASHGEATLSAATGALRGRGSAAFESPPEWRLDDECAICRATFNMFKHRHHCRNCGKSICRQHSADKKIPMASKGFSTPQRVCITCFAVIAQSRSLQRDLALTDLADEALLNPVAAFQQQHYAGSSVGSSGPALRSTAASSAGTAAARKSSLRSSLVAGSSPSSNAVNGASGAVSMPTTSSAAVSPAAPATDAAMTSRELALSAQVQELRALVGAQQRQLEQLAQSNTQLQHQLLDHEEEKAETTLLITQLMTRVSALELGRGREEDAGEGNSDGEEGEERDCRRTGSSGSR